MARVKRSIEEIVNKSDSDDDDYSDHPARPSRSARSKSKKKAKPAKKRRRRDSDDDIVSDDDLISEGDELSYNDSDIEEDLNVERNAKGVPRRRAARNRPVYNEGESSSFDDREEDDEDEDEEESAVIKHSPGSKRSNVITLKVGKALKSQFGSEPFQSSRRSTRHNRDPSEDIYALTNSGRHVETVERGTHSPEAQISRPRRGAKSVPTKSTIAEDEEEAVDHEPKNSQLEIMESDPQGDFEEGPLLSKKEEEKVDVEMGEDAGFVPESENGDAKVGGEEDEEEEDDDEGPTTRRRTRPNRQTEEHQSEKETSQPPRSSRKKPPKSSQRRRDEDESDFEPNEEDESNDDDISEPGRSRGSPSKNQDDEDDTAGGRRPGLRKRKSQSRGHSEARGDIAEELAEELENLRGDRPRRKVQPEIIYEKPRRSRKDVDYRIIRPDLILPIEEAENEPSESPSRRGRGGGGGTWQRTLFSTYGPFGGGGPAAVLAPPGAPGATGGVESDSSDDETMQQPKGAAPGPGVGTGLLGATQTHGDTGQGLSGTPANLGKIKDKQALADADPLGVDPNVNFDSVGGLQGHIDQLKEMVTLPLLYPEIFQRFHIVPPRGVLFHGPPGTGKTLLARALASSVSSEGRKVTFYMRKGADALSKWVGEAERQLRLLFEEARKTQPSIIFFDEIDGK